MTSLLLLVAAPSLAVSVYLVAEAASAPARDRDASLRRASRYGRQAVSTGTRLGRRDRVVASLARLALRLSPQTQLGTITADLRAAGLGQRLSPQDFLAVRVATTAFGAGLGVLLFLSVGLVRGILLGLVLTAIGYLAPVVVLRRLVRRRRQQIAPALPDALDLLSVCVEAGLGLDAALQKLTEHMHGPLTDELELMLSEIRIGESRQEALRRLADRVGAPELTAVVRAILHADQQGTPLTRVLAVQAAETRAKRASAAENEANKAPVKLLFPTMIFIFPALFVVILGPALLTISSSL